MSLSNSGDKRYSDICGATNNRGEPCKLPAGWGTPGTQGGRCRYHGGASTGPDNTEHLENNNFAEGNPGGSPPTGNINAKSHGAFCDWEKAYDRLDDAQRGYVERIRESFRDHIPECVDIEPERREELLRERQTLRILENRAWVDLLAVNDDGSGPGRGFTVETEQEIDGETYTVKKANPALEAERRARSRIWKISKELRLWPGFQE